MEKFTDMFKEKIRASLRRLLALMCCLGLTACASVSIPRQPANDYINGLLERNEFDSALMVVDRWQASYPDNAELPEQRKNIAEAIGRFEANALKSAKQFDLDGHWQQANNVYENALQKLPSSQSLQTAYSEFSARRLKHISAIKEDLDVAQAKHWIAVNADIAALYRAAPNDPDAEAWKEKIDLEREQLARRLVDYGLIHEGNEHFGTAALRYDLAYRLAPGEYTKPFHQRAAKTFAQRKAKQEQRSRENLKRQQSKLDQLIAEFDNYLAKDEFRLARQTLGAMEAIDAKSPEVIERREKLDKQRDEALNEAILQGKKYYTEGEFDSAIRVWKQALQLDPENKELKENIQRAEKFRENLERLKQE